jgi:hypothetical protein
MNVMTVYDLLMISGKPMIRLGGKYCTLKLNGTHQLPAYADDVNLLRDNIDTI